MFAQFYIVEKNSKNNKAKIFEYKQAGSGLKIVDVDDDKMMIVAVSQAENGMATFDEQNVYYTPNREFNAVDRFNVSISDFNDTVSFAVEFTVQNSAPVGMCLVFV